MDGNSEQAKKNISITQVLLAKTYGEPYWNENWPEILSEGGFVIIGSDVTYDSRSKEEVTGKPNHTWCWWGWNAGRPVRFDSGVDAELFAKTLKCQDEDGREYGRNKATMVLDTNDSDVFRSDDDAFPFGEED